MLLGTNRSEDAYNSKTNAKNNSSKDDKSNAGEHLNDEVFEQENEIPSEKMESIQTVSAHSRKKRIIIFLFLGSFLDKIFNTRIVCNCNL